MIAMFFHRDPTCRFSMNPRATGNCLLSVALAAKGFFKRAYRRVSWIRLLGLSHASAFPHRSSSLGHAGSAGN